MWKIGSVEIESQVVAAPLAGISNPVYRQLCHSYGAGLVVSEMISDKALHFRNQRTFDMCRTVPGEHPVSLQLFGGDPETMAEAARYLDEHTDCDVIDINMGCPVTKVLKAHAGSWLMANPDIAAEVAKAVVSNTKKPVTVKMRAGWDQNHINCADLAMRLEQAGVSAIAVHGRTKSQYYSGNADLSYIRMVKEAVSIPVIGNGDIRSVSDAKRMLEETRCDAVMVGRGLLGKPYLIEELNRGLRGEPYEEPSYEARLDLCLDYAEKLCAYEGEHTAISMMRGMAAWYVAGMPYSAECKAKLSGMNSLAEMREIISAYRLRLNQKE